MPLTKNESERMQRPSVLHRKVTNGQRSQWEADLFGSVRSAVRTGSLNDQSHFGSIASSLEGKSRFDPV